MLNSTKRGKGHMFLLCKKTNPALATFYLSIMYFKLRLLTRKPIHTKINNFNLFFFFLSEQNSKMVFEFHETT